MTERIFGTDGVRASANDVLTPELATRLGRALVIVEQESGTTRPSVLIGRDTRWSGELVESAVAAGVMSAGGDAVLAGVVPTPAIAHLAVADDHDAGIVISASHNAMPDNGIKFFGGDGFKLTDAQEDRIEEVLHGDVVARPVGDQVGRRREDQTAVDRYVDHLASLPTDGLDGLHVVVDAANGAASDVTPRLLERLGARVTAISAAPDGRNINDGCGSTHPEAMQRAVVAHGADVGIAHDGDADRLIAADAAGALVDGDAILAILARDLRDRDKLRANTVVTTVMTNLGFHHAMQELDIAVRTTGVGDRYVLEELRTDGLTLGGEQSGHVINLDVTTTGDGVLTALRLLRCLKRADAPLADVAALMQRLPQQLVNVGGVDKARLDEAVRTWDEVRAVEAELGDGGRVLLRKSGTEPLVRVMVEAPTQELADASADRIATVVRDELALG